MALGASGDEQYAPLLRRIMTTDPYWEVRAFAAEGLMEMLGPRALVDLRVAAGDEHEKVRAAAITHAFNMLELLGPRHFGRASAASVAEARAFITPLLEDPSQAVRDNAKWALAYIAQYTAER
jgi:HEAT repeat protein